MTEKNTLIHVRHETKALLSKAAKELGIHRIGLVEELAKALVDQESKLFKIEIIDKEGLVELYATGHKRWAQLQEFVEHRAKKLGITSVEDLDRDFYMVCKGYGITEKMVNRMLKNVLEGEDK